MGMRETIETHKTWGVRLSLTVGIAAIAYSLWSTHRAAQLPGPTSQVYFSDDEGKSYFADDVEKVFPFDHNGKQAYRAYVFRCGDSSGPFVGLLGRQAQHAESSSDPRFKSDARSSPIEVKRPGDEKWVPFNSVEGKQLIASVCPGGRPEAVLP